jgi:hypothetical protein
MLSEKYWKRFKCCHFEQSEKSAFIRFWLFCGAQATAFVFLSSRSL